MTALDQVDQNIIQQLQKDGRMPFTDIAKSLEISEGTVRNRVARMVEDRILQVIGMVDPLQLGYDAPAMIGVSVQPPNLESAIKQIADFPEVSYLIMVSGDYDLYVEVMCRDRDHLAEFLNQKLRKIKGVVRTQTSLILKTYKLAYGADPYVPDKFSETIGD